MTSRSEPTAVVGVPETRLDDEVAARLPGTAPSAPWSLAGRGVAWVHRGGRAARAALAVPGGRLSGLLVVGAAVRYTTSPVGAYDEVLGAVAAHGGGTPWASVAFMAVDSEASVAGGRASWALPKTLASFTGEPASAAGVTATGAGQTWWRVRVSSRAFGPRLPVAARGQLRQAAGGSVRRSPLRGRARLRLALVTVHVESSGPLPTWLRSGRHVGAVVEEAAFELGAPVVGRRASRRPG